jgi:hypothetical protein
VVCALCFARVQIADGVMVAVVRAMDAFVDDVAVCEAAAAALWGLVSSRSPDALEALRRVDGAGRAVRAMQRFPSSTVLQRSCCELLRCVTVDPVGKAAVMAADGMAAVLKAMAAHDSDVDLLVRWRRGCVWHC